MAESDQLLGEGDELPTMVEKKCQFELEQSLVCIKANIAACGCFDASNFSDSFPREIRKQFYTAQAWLPPTDNNFCEVANQRVCQHYDVVQACCCNELTTLYRECLINNYLVFELPIRQPCRASCDEIDSEFAGVPTSPQDIHAVDSGMANQQDNDSDRSNAAAIVLGVFLSAIVLIATSAFIFLWYRKHRWDVPEMVDARSVTSRDGVVGMKLKDQDAAIKCETPYDDETSYDNGVDIENRSIRRQRDNLHLGRSDAHSEAPSTIDTERSPQFQNMGVDSKMRGVEIICDIQKVDMAAPLYKKKAISLEHTACIKDETYSPGTRIKTPFRTRKDLKKERIEIKAVLSKIDSAMLYLEANIELSNSELRRLHRSGQSSRPTSEMKQSSRDDDAKIFQLESARQYYERRLTIVDDKLMLLRRASSKSTERADSLPAKGSEIPIEVPVRPECSSIKSRRQQDS